MAKTARFFVLALSATLALATSAQAQSRGASMDSVRSQLGEPQSVAGPVGDPPITRWFYADNIVYFEYDKVITSFAPQALPQLQRRDGLRPASGAPSP